MESENAGLNKILAPLYKAGGWIKFTGIVLIITGVFTAFSVLGLLIFWMSIWMGVILYSASNMLKKAYENGHADGFEEAMRKLALYFKLFCIFTVLSFLIGLTAAILIPAFATAA